MINAKSVQALDSLRKSMRIKTRVVDETIMSKANHGILFGTKMVMKTGDHMQRTPRKMVRVGV